MTTSYNIGITSGFYLPGLIAGCVVRSFIMRVITFVGALCETAYRRDR